MSAYSDKLLDPRWQKRRLEVFERAKWQCQACYSKDDTLHVHHLVYTAGEPWEEPVQNLECLCEHCHGQRELFNEYWGRSRFPTRLARIFDRILRSLILLEHGAMEWRKSKFKLKLADQKYWCNIGVKEPQCTNGTDWSI